MGRQAKRRQKKGQNNRSGGLPEPFGRCGGPLFDAPAPKALEEMAILFISNLEESVKFRSNAYARHLLDDQMRSLQTEIRFLFESSNVLS
jgi:hypothetical protein